MDKEMNLPDEVYPKVATMGGQPNHVRTVEVQAFKQVRINPVPGVRLAGFRFWVDRLKTHQPHYLATYAYILKREKA
jgi:hypothetical protein